MKAFLASLSLCVGLTLVAVSIEASIPLLMVAGCLIAPLGLFLTPRPSPFGLSGLEALAARYVRGGLDLLDFLEAVDAWEPGVAASPIQPSHQAPR